MTKDTIFHWASVTKCFTAVVVMQLRDAGALSLEDPVVKYLPELACVHNPYGAMSGLTVRHLLTHTSGLRAASFPWGGDQAWQPMEPASYAQIVAMLPYTQVEFEPGSRVRYSNLGVLFLGRLIEVIAG